MTTPITTTADRLMEQQPFGYVSDGFADGLRFQHAPWPELHSLTNSIAAVYSSSQWGALCSAIKEMAAERDALRAALKPFADAPAEYLAGGIYEVTLNWRDLINARKLLENGNG